MIYLDNCSTTKTDDEVFVAMKPYLTYEYGNPSSKYYELAENAKAAVEASRVQISEFLNCRTDEIVFTSGASESNNFILKGIADYMFYEKNKGNNIITSKAEHKSILETCQWLSKRGFEVTYLDVNKYGEIDINDLFAAINKKTILVSLIWVNNETGSINPIHEVARICNDKKIFFHTDATQALGKVNINLKNTPIDFMSITAHKLYGPKGVGACFIKKTPLGIKQKLTPLIHGGSQEFGYRAGTHAVHNIVGFGKAIEIANLTFEENKKHMKELEQYFIKSLQNSGMNFFINGNINNKIYGVLNITIPKLNNELTIKKLSNDIAISSGSACALSEPSHVLSAMGIELSLIYNSFRVSFGKFTSRDVIDEFISKISIC